MYDTVLTGPQVLAHYQAAFLKRDIVAASAGQATVTTALTKGRALVAASAGRATITLTNNRIGRGVALRGTSVGTVQNVYRRVVMADTPFAYWRLDEPSGNWLDSSGGARNATALGVITRSQPAALGEGYANDLSGGTPLSDPITSWSGGVQQAGPQLQLAPGNYIVRSPYQSVPFAGIWRWYVPLKIDVNNAADKDSFTGEFSVYNPSNNQIYRTTNGGPNTSNKAYFPRDLSTTAFPANWDLVGNHWIDFYWDGVQAIEFRNERKLSEGPLRTVYQGTGWIRSPGYAQTPYLSPFNGTTGWTVEMWLRCNLAAWPTSYDMGLFTVGDAYANGQLIHLLARAGGGLANCFYNDDYNSGTTPSLNAWHHVVFSFGGPANKIQRIHMDGVQLNGNYNRPTTYTPAIATGAATGNGAQIGIINGGYFPGLLDDVAVYAYQLTPAQVITHYQAGPLAPAQLTKIKYLTVRSDGRATTTAFIYGGTPKDEYGALVATHPYLTAYWRLGDRAGTTVFDSAPTHAHPGTYIGSPVLGVPGALTSQADSGVNFNGTTDYVDIPDFAMTQQSGTVEAWFKADTWSASSCLINRRTPGNVGGFSLEINGGVPYFHIHNGTTWNSIGSSRPALATGVWHHVAGVWAGGSSLLMVNGEDVGRLAFTGPMYNPAGAVFRLGQNIAGAQTIDGVLDEVAIYWINIADAEVQSHYRVGVKARNNYGLAVERTPGLVARWTFDEKLGNLIYDHTGNGRTVLLSGPATPWGSGIGGDYEGTGGSGEMRYFNGAGGPSMGAARALPLAQFSIEAWFYPIGNQPAGVGNAPCILGDEYSGNINYALWMDGGTNVLRAAIHEGAVGWALMTGNVTLQNTAWAHIVATYDNLYLRLYINGVEAAAPGGPRAGPFLSAGVGLRIGRRWDLADYVNGIIDEVAMYDRPLTLAQVQEHHAKGFGNPWYINLAGSAAGTSTVNETLDKWEGMLGATAGKATATGLISRVRPLVASSAGVATVSQVLQRKRNLAASAPGVSTASGSLKARRSMVATAPGTSTTSIVLQRVKSLVVGAVGVGTASGAATRRRALVASSVGLGVATGPTTRLRPLSGTAPGAASVNVLRPTAYRRLFGTSVGLSVAYGRMAMSGLAIGRATVTTTAITARRRLLATSVGGSTTTEILTVYRRLVATSAGVATEAGEATARRRLVAASTGTSTASGQPRSIRNLSASSTGTGTAAGTTTRRRSVVAASTGVATATGVARRARPVFATSAGVATTTVAIGRRRSLVVASAGVAIATAPLINRVKGVTASPAAGLATINEVLSAYRRLVASTASGTSTVVALVTRVRRFQSVSAAGVATAAGQPGVVKPIVAAAAGKTTVAVLVSRRRRINPISASNGYTLIVAFIGRKRTILGTTVIVGTSTTSGQPSRRRALFGAVYCQGTASAIIGKYLGMQHVLWEYHGAQFIFPPEPGMHEVIWEESSDQFVLDPHESEITTPG